MTRHIIDWWSEERAARKRGFSVIAGIDEAGRGPLAGPVVAACVILPFGVEIPLVRDSKTLSRSQRESAFASIQQCAEAVGVGVADVEAIDRLNILRASHQAMREALQSISCSPSVALIDGLPVQPFPIPQIAVVKGDGKSASIAAASIVAKVTRDRMMEALHPEYPLYGFASHKGYATAEHVAALREHGPCAIHRRSFSPIEELLFQPSLPFSDGPRKELGMNGETVAQALLQRSGWEIIETQYHCHGGELDIIAMDGAALVFVEVKTRRGGGFGPPAAAVDFQKRSRMLTAATQYLTEREIGDCECRFDVMEVVFGRDGHAKVNLIRDAFRAGE
jgi:uncharacterized protein (TIGR00252 family)